MTPDIEIAVVGAGVVGLASAAALARASRDVVVLERRGKAGTEVSQRSSEVLHAGLYYPPGSLKARLCRDGNTRAHQFARAHGVGLRTCGKLLVATSEDEQIALIRIAENARANGVPGIERLTGAETRAREPDVHCIEALYSPATSVVDSQGLLTALEGELGSHGGSIVFDSNVTGITTRSDGCFDLMIESAGERARLVARRLVLAGGLHASQLGAMIPARNGYEVPATYYAKGHYFALRGTSAFHHLIYPIPSSGGLGIHLTIDTAGSVRFGPDIAWTDTIDYRFEDDGGHRCRAFEAAIRRYWPGLPDGALEQAYTGIRPKLTRAGEPPADFAIHDETAHGVPGLVALYGIDSPGLTASLAIGDYIAGRFSWH